MFFRNKMTGPDASAPEKLEALHQALQDAETVILGAGAGLSTAAGFEYAGARFETYFSDFRKKYGFTDMYSGGFYPFPTEEERWAFWSRNIYINRYVLPPKPVYRELLGLVNGKDYFVLTTNVDHQFQKAGFDKQRLFYTQGDYGLWQCSAPCHRRTYDNKGAVVKMLLAQGFLIGEGGQLLAPEHPDGTTDFTKLSMSVPSELAPRCPVCGEPMSMNLRADDTFVEDEGWQQAARRYSEFLETRRASRTLFLETGVGFNTPGIIKYPFWRMTRDWPDAVYACLNHGQAFAPEELAEKSVCVDGDLGQVIKQLQHF